ncbi:glycogen debranching protein GlgX [Thioflexithrix psekupsensis]|uniref:Glycogen debranching enzyme GlgX n=1 Tax=Thioflexithrix psekupsensis TaxID=1570016 RepID=A0A251XAA5_9GAMM|nr:glycogen debranching protein GlgX [Thioflexithrix psekupsensis]OUD14452.1 glycogen debranching enzyme GlgX [Thioflexithrix psekupsensis]
MNTIYNLEIQRGYPLPLGATLLPNGVNFAVFSSSASSVSLVLFAPREYRSEFRREIRLRSRIHRTGHIWHVFVAGIGIDWEYAYHVAYDPNHAPSFLHLEREQLLLDPYAKLIQGRPEWSVPQQASRRRIFASGVRRGVVVADHYAWEADRPLHRPYAETVIYELHVRGFTRHPSAQVNAKAGTFAALTEKIPYLQQLGVTAVELLPIHEFDEAENPRRNPQNGAFLANYWGYSSINWFAPKLSYADNPQQVLNELKSMVKAFHCAGIEVFLDVVFNHTAEGDQHGVTFSLKGFDNEVYYLLTKDKTAYLNYSGCGNTINANHPVVSDLIIDCLRYWVLEMHIDGFRFDLASILCRGQQGEVLPLPPLIQRIAQDPILAQTKLIAEAWDAAGLYQVGQFPCPQRWAEWNGRFRDDIRRFLKGDGGQIMGLKNRLMGSPDLYHAPWRSINFITSHDGFTLHDLVSYNQKYNEANGENNQDGDSHNNSWNCGQEGETINTRIIQLRQRQMKNFLALLFLSQGTPMLVAGDECGRTQLGNNNAYCQDNEISWFHWQLVEKNADLWRFCQQLILLRRHETLFQQNQFLSEHHRHVPHVQWHGVKLSCPDWSWESRSLALQLRSDEGYYAAHYYLIINAFWDNLTFELPPLPSRQSWYRFIDTYLSAPEDIAASLQETVRLTQQDHYAVSGRSVVLLVARTE